MTSAQSDSRQLAGYWLGVLGVLIFAITLPATRRATGSGAAPQLSPAFVTAGRAALAGLLSAAFLLATRSAWPQRRHWRSLLLAVAGNVLGFPVMLAIALRSVTATHAAVVMALGPLATAVAVALMMGQRARPAFWVCALAGSGLVMCFAWLRAHGAGGFGLAWADVLLIGAVVAAAIGYVAGAQVSPVLGAERTICWICAAALPISLPAAWWLWPGDTAGIRPSAWAGFVYVGVFSMWAGFFAWYRGLDWGGALRVSQIQLLQPFLAMLFAVPLLGERLDAMASGCALAVVATVFLSRRLARPVTASEPPA